MIANWDDWKNLFEGTAALGPWLMESWRRMLLYATCVLWGWGLPTGVVFSLVLRA